METNAQNNSDYTPLLPAIFRVGAVVNIILLTLSVGLGFFYQHINLSVTVHIVVGLAAAISNLIVHCFIFGMFIGTGIGIKEALDRYKIEGNYRQRIRYFKAVIFPFSLFAMLLVILVSAWGSAASVGRMSIGWHRSMALFTYFFNLYAFYRENLAVTENSAIMQAINKIADKQHASQPLETKRPEQAQELDENIDVPASLTWGKWLFFAGCSVWLVFFYMHRVHLAYFSHAFFSDLNQNPELNINIVPYVLVSLGSIISGRYLMRRGRSQMEHSA